MKNIYVLYIKFFTQLQPFLSHVLPPCTPQPCFFTALSYPLGSPASLVTRRITARPLSIHVPTD